MKRDEIHHAMIFRTFAFEDLSHMMPEDAALLFLSIACLDCNTSLISHFHLLI